MRFRIIAVVVLTFVVLLAGCSVGTVNHNESMGDDQAMIARGLAEMEQSNYIEAIDAFTAAIELSSEMAKVYEYRADAYLASGNAMSATADYEKVFALAGESAELFIKLGDARLASGETHLAIEAYSSAYDLDKTIDGLSAKLCSAYISSGDPDAALITAYNAFQSSGDEYFFELTRFADESSTLEQYQRLTTSQYLEFKGLPPSLLYNSHPETEFLNGIDPNVLCFIEGNGYSNVDANNSFAYCYHTTSSVHQFCDSIWGPNRMEISNWNEQCGWTYSGENLGHDAILGRGWEPLDFYGMSHVSISDKTASVLVRRLRLESGNGGDCTGLIGFNEKKLIEGAYKNYSYDGPKYDWERFGTVNAFDPYDGRTSAEVYNYFVGHFGISEEKLVLAEFVFYNTADGTRLWGVFPSGQAEYPPNEMIAAPLLPEITLDKLDEVKSVTIAANDGLRLRSGPGTDYEVITLIDDGSSIKSYGERDGWLYVRYLGRFGWVSAEYIIDAE